MNLDDIRKEIDETDKEMSRLFERRMKLAGDVAAFKLETGDCIYKPDREQAVIDRFKSGASDNMKWYYEAFIRRLMLISREYQYSIISERGNHCSYGDIVTAIGDMGAVVTDLNKDGDMYTVVIKGNIEPEKLRVLSTLVECESDTVCIR